MPEAKTVLQVIPRMRAGGAELGCLQIAEALVKAGNRAIVKMSENSRHLAALLIGAAASYAFTISVRLIAVVLALGAGLLVGSNLYDVENTQIVHHLDQSLKAVMMFKRDIDYVVEDGKVVIIDEFTGRKMSGRRWSDGLHQAVEAKEKVKIERENQTLATITFQNYFRMYNKLSGSCC